MWMQKQDAFKQKFGDPILDKVEERSEEKKSELLADWSNPVNRDS